MYGVSGQHVAPRHKPNTAHTAFGWSVRFYRHVLLKVECTGDDQAFTWSTEQSELWRVRNRIPALDTRIEAASPWITMVVHEQCLTLVHGVTTLVWQGILLLLRTRSLLFVNRFTDEMHSR